MSFYGRRQEDKEKRVPDIERRRGKNQLSPVRTGKRSAQFWFNFWLCVLSISVDPFFFYIPVINEIGKCVKFDRTLYIVVVCLRTLLDCISLGVIILPFLCSSLDKEKETKGDTTHKETEGGTSTRKETEDTSTHTSTHKETEGDTSTLHTSTHKEMEGHTSTHTSDHCLRIKRYLKVANDIAAILPIPQVLFLFLFTKMRGSNSLNKRKVLSGVVLLQYLPRALRLYLSGTKVFSQSNALSKTVRAVKGGLNLLLFIIASHIMGGSWYFFSVERETACWHLACEKQIECSPSYFACNHESFGNFTFLNESCPIAAPNITVFDFGMFQGAIQSGTVASMDFPRKLMYCFWWGLRSLSSFGSNLQTSPYIWENGFAVITSISGLVLFLCFLGHLQMYMQWEEYRRLEEAQQEQKKQMKETQREQQRQLEEAERKQQTQLEKAQQEQQRQLELAQQEQQRQLEEAQREQQRLKKVKHLEDFKQRWKSRMDSRRNKIIVWLDRRRRLSEIRKEIIGLVDKMFEEKERQIMSEAGENIVAAESKMPPSEYEDIDEENPLTYLPLNSRRKIRHHLCFPLLQKVPFFQNESEDLLTLIIKDYMKEVSYNEKSYIAREGEPLDALLFITQGIVFTYTSNPDDRQTGYLEIDDFYGVELIEWIYKYPSMPNPSKHPFSSRTLRCHTKVEGYALTAGNIRHLLHQQESKFGHRPPRRAAGVLAKILAKREALQGALDFATNASCGEK